MSKEVDDFFDEIETEIPEDISRLVEKQMDISEAIAAAIVKSEYKSQKEFAEAIGMKPSMLSRILAGNVNLTLKTITKIEAALGTEIININAEKSFQGFHVVLHGTRFLSYNPQEPAIPFINNNVGNMQYLENDDIISGYDYNVKEEMTYGRA